MKRFRRFLVATVLALAFSVPAFAGDMWAGITSQPPSQPATAESTSGSVSETTAVDPVTELALDLLQSLLSLF